MRLTEAQDTLRIGDRILFRTVERGLREATILEMSPTFKFYRLQYLVYGSDYTSWQGVSVVVERLNPLLKQKGWFS